MIYHRKLSGSWMIGILLLAIAGVAVLRSPAAQADLPPRPTVTPTVTSTPVLSPLPTPSSTSRVLQKLEGGHIRLDTPFDRVWSVVQWQDSSGQWHDVEGWRGYTRHGSKRWWVAPRDFGTGPFRWVVTLDNGAGVIVSVPFMLPASSGEIIIVQIGSGLASTTDP